MTRRKILFAFAGTLAVFAVPLLVLYFAYPRTLLDCVVALQRSSAGFDRRHVQVEDWRVPYIDSGPNDKATEQTILFLHGFGETKDRCINLASGLTDQYRVLALDLPGFGESAIRLDEDYSAEFFADIILAFLDRLECDSVHLVGYSMGGMLAAKVASEAPHRVRTLTLLAPAGLRGAEPSEVDRIFSRQGEIPLTYRNRESFDRLLQLNFNQPLDLPDFAVRALVAEGSQRADLHEKIFRQSLVPAETKTFVNQVARLRIRTLVIWGTADRILDVSAADRWAEINPDIRIIKLPDVGHALIYYRTSKIQAELRSHLGSAGGVP